MAFIETKNDLLADLNLNGNYEYPSLEVMSEGETRFLKDLRINLKNAIKSDNLNKKEAYLIALAIAVNDKNEKLINAFTKYAKDNEATAEELAETHACAAMLATNNVFYRFKHFTKNHNENYQKMPAGIKMNVMIKPVLGKEFFELMSLAVSAVNGCESCVNSHEESVRNAGGSEVRIFDTIRLASIVRGLSVSLN